MEFRRPHRAKSGFPDTTAGQRSGRQWLDFDHLQRPRGVPDVSLGATSRATSGAVPEVRRIGVVGAGIMGQGIAQVALQGGLEVVLVDVNQAAAEKGAATIRQRLERLVEKGSLSENDARAAIGRLRVDRRLDALSTADAVIEAVFEDLELKRRIFAELEAAVSESCVLATNSSSLLVASIARGLRRPQRVAGMHFFNPVPLMKLVEVIDGPESDEASVELLMELGRVLGREPVRVRDAPGFLVNLGGRAFTTEAIRILHEQVARPADIDAVMRDCHGFRMGPCELMDLTGVDVNYPVCGFIAEGYSNDPRLQTYFPHRALFEAGRFGRKTGQGHYGYVDGRKIEPEDEAAGASKAKGAAPPARVVLAERGEAGARIGEILSVAGVELSEDDDSASPCVIAPIGADCSRAVVERGLDPARTVAVDPLGDLGRRVCVMTAPGAVQEHRDGVVAAFEKAGRAVTAIADSPGFVGQRICAMIANLGCEMAQMKLAEATEIDRAMELGLNYPRGPLALCDHHGPKTVLAILRQLQELTGEDRYRPSPWLRRRAELGLPAATPP